MIRLFQNADIDKVANIWLGANLEAHDFVPARYWQSNFSSVKEMLPQAEVYVHEEAGQIQGFIGLDGNYIAGIFVLSEVRSKGIGTQLLDFVKTIKTELSLRVYQKNVRAVSFYQREGFAILSEGADENTNEPEYRMMWKTACPNRENVIG